MLGPADCERGNDDDAAPLDCRIGLILRSTREICAGGVARTTRTMARSLLPSRSMFVEQPATTASKVAADRNVLIERTPR